MIVENSIFTKNLAYLAGNAIYYFVTHDSFYTHLPYYGVSLLRNNTFRHNNGLKAHHGGAVSYINFFSDRSRSVSDSAF